MLEEQYEGKGSTKKSSITVTYQKVPLYMTSMSKNVVIKFEDIVYMSFSNIKLDNGILK